VCRRSREEDRSILPLADGTSFRQIHAELGLKRRRLLARRTASGRAIPVPCAPGPGIVLPDLAIASPNLSDREVSQGKALWAKLLGYHQIRSARDARRT